MGSLAKSSFCRAVLSLSGIAKSFVKSATEIPLSIISPFSSIFIKSETVGKKV